MSKAYYNEIDKNCAQWLRNLIAAGLIAPGDVDERSIEDVSPDDLVGYTQCHFFAGIGVWSYALRLARWPDDRPLWTGSCPCQSFSAAGKQKGFDDKRHLWPSWFRLIRERKPPVVFGEQVEAAIRHGWLDLVQSDLEGQGYALGKAVLGACSVGAPHIRQRLWFVAESNSELHDGGRNTGPGWRSESSDRRDINLLGNSVLPGLQGLPGDDDRSDEPGRVGPDAAGPSAEAVVPCWLAFPYGWNACAERVQRGGEHGQRATDGGVGGLAFSHEQHDDTRGRDTSNVCGERDRTPFISGSQSRFRRSGPTNGFWRDTDWLLCRDGKWRPVETRTFPLAHGIAGRVGKLRAFGNAISPWVAKEFIESYMEVRKMDKGE